MARQAGRQAEAAAAAALAARGYRIVARNVRCPFGELDLVARHGPLLVVVEVRARSPGLGQGGLEQAACSVTAAKRRRILQAARWWLSGRPELLACPIRFDVVAVDLGPQGRPQRIVHVPGAFGADGW